MRNILSPNHPIHVRKAPTKYNPNYVSCTISISSKKIVTDLANYEVVPRKSWIVNWPQNIPYKFVSSCILGCFDGDGSWSPNRGHVTWGLCAGREEFLQQVQLVLMRRIGLPQTKICTASETGTKYLRWGGRLECQKLAHFMYDNATIWMDRKRDLAGVLL